ncbi:MAG: hypothetical protein US94_C0007G0016, partial [Berkelbacteria bacterium GW2011_GWB1_38_5]
MKKTRFVDGIYFWRKESKVKKKKNRQYLVLLILIPIIVSLFFVTKIS